MQLSKQTRLWMEILSAKGVRPSRWLRLSTVMPLERIADMITSGTGCAELERLLARTIDPPDGVALSRCIEVLENVGCGAFSVSDACYPTLLREIPDPPPLLYFRGETGILGRPAICIVGSRGASRRGRVVAAAFARDLSRRGIAVVSGLARGIDRAAHEGALRGDGGTCAVLGCGIDLVYPPEHDALAGEIARNGLVLSEFPPGTKPLRHHFPLRNRLLSGLSLGVAVIEADVTSGALGTARWAVEQNREIFAVPGPIEYPGSRGPHRLIRQGAHLVERVEDILAELPPCGRVAEEADTPVTEIRCDDLSPDERVVFYAIGCEPKHIDELVEICHIPATAILPILLNLEMRGMVAPCGGGSFTRTSFLEERVP
ncbi:MAG: DNA-processing protein DprA [bacterium]|nr:MAG: DNA-processing protein DprA [bacterium]